MECITVNCVKFVSCNVRYYAFIVSRWPCILSRLSWFPAPAVSTNWPFCMCWRAVKHHSVNQLIHFCSQLNLNVPSPLTQIHLLTQSPRTQTHLYWNEPSWLFMLLSFCTLLVVWYLLLFSDFKFVHYNFNNFMWRRILYVLFVITFFIESTTVPVNRHACSSITV